FVLVCHSALTQLSLGPATIPGLGIGSSGTIASAAPDSAAEPAASAVPAASAAPLSAPVSRGSGVQLSSGAWPESAGEITAVVNAADIPLLGRFENLYLLNLDGSTCYAELAEYVKTHPDVFVTYSVTLPDGQRVPYSTRSLALTSVDRSRIGEYAAALQGLPYLKTIDLGTASVDAVFSAEDLSLLHDAAPDAAISYSLSLLGQRVDLADKTVDLSSMTSGQVSEAAAVLKCMANVERVILGSEGNGLSWNDIGVIRDAAPNAALDYGFTVCGVAANLADETLSLSHVSMNDEGAAVRAVLPYMTKLKKLDMDSCNVSNGAMEALRNDFPAVDVIWRVWFGNTNRYSVRTDVEKILASKPSEAGELNNSHVAVLKYCNHAKYVDLGHNSQITDISFVRGMPDLEVFIIALNAISDISPLADCPKLEFLETTYSNVSDLTPLANLTELRHINLGDCPVHDLSPLLGLPNLERVWLGYKTAQGCDQSQIQQLRDLIASHIPEPPDPMDARFFENPYYGVNTEAGTPSEGDWKIVAATQLSLKFYAETYWLKDVYHPRYQLLREQFGYDNQPFCYSFSENDPLY
ncbi:MAG: hypothetical protein J6P58_09845, partial [Oscillospiraceae bacterium]|nr:hypothetical protein [Oscillospiraceae bacterium]